MSQRRDNPLNRWRAQGYQPLLVRNDQGQWALTFGSEGGLGPEWSDWGPEPIWQATEEEAIQSALLDEQLAMEHQRTIARKLDD